MPPKTRTTKKEEGDVDNEEISGTMKKELPKDDKSFDRKIVVAKIGSVANSKLIILNHPKEGSALFRITKDHFDEVLTVDDGHRSLFYGESVIENGAIHFFAPYNSNFIVLPYFYKNKGKFMEIEEILKCEKHRGIEELIGNEKIMKGIEQIADVKEAIDTKVYRFNEEKLLEWIGGKFEKLKKKMEEETHKTLVSNDEAYNRYIFGFLSDFLSPEIATIVKEHLKIKDAVQNDIVDMSMKRKAMDEDDEIPKVVAKKPRESIATKKLQAASKGTKSISSFFGKK